MIGIGLALLAAWLYWEVRAVGRMHRQLGGGPRLLLGPDGAVRCRACGTRLDDPMFRIDLGHGAVVCEPCEEEINKELPLSLPEWFERPLPPDPPPAAKAAPPPKPVKILPPMRPDAVCDMPNCADPACAKAVSTFRCVLCWEDHPTSVPLCPNYRDPDHPHRQKTCNWCPNKTVGYSDLCDQCITCGPPKSFYIRA